MKLEAMVFLLLFLNAFPPEPTSAGQPPTSLQQQPPVSAATGHQEVMADPIRHGKKRRKNRIGLVQRKRRKKLKNATTRRFAEKQYLVHNRTLALLGDDVEKILLTRRVLGVELPLNGGRVLPLAEGGGSRGGDLGLRRATSDSGQNKISRERGPEVSLAAVGPEVGGRGEGYGSPELSPQEEAVQRDLINFIMRLVKDLSELTLDSRENATHCERWLESREKLDKIFLGPLPSCPCSYPTKVAYEDKIWDNQQQRYYRWRDASGESERLDIYKIGAKHCIRSLANPLGEGQVTSLASQHCCYDRDRKLITRGSGAGNPNYVSPDASRPLHERLDLLPWKLCKGDFTRFNQMRPPNNGNQCAENPKDKIYEKQVKLAKFF